MHPLSQRDQWACAFHLSTKHGAKGDPRTPGCQSCHSDSAQHLRNPARSPDVVFGAKSKMLSPVEANRCVPRLPCHNPHGSTGPVLMVKNTITETCYTCHSEKRGPFLWEHAPVVEDCTNRHSPHGSNVTPILKTRPPMLCQTRHTSDHAEGLYSAARSALRYFKFKTACARLPIAIPANRTIVWVVQSKS